MASHLRIPFRSYPNWKLSLSITYSVPTMAVKIFGFSCFWPSSFLSLSLFYLVTNRNIHTQHRHRGSHRREHLTGIVSFCITTFKSADNNRSSPFHSPPFLKMRSRRPLGALSLPCDRRRSNELDYNQLSNCPADGRDRLDPGNKFPIS